MDKQQEIKSLADRLLQNGIVSTHMDAMNMAANMLNVDISPSSKPIDNLKPKKVEFTEMPRGNVEAPVDELKSLNEILAGADKLEDVQKEVQAIEDEPEDTPDEEEIEEELAIPDMLEKEANADASDINLQEVESEVQTIEDEPDDIVEEQEVEEMLTPIHESSTTEDEIEREVVEIEHEPDAKNSVEDEDEIVVSDITKLF